MISSLFSKDLWDHEKNKVLHNYTKCTCLLDYTMQYLVTTVYQKYMNVRHTDSNVRYLVNAKIHACNAYLVILIVDYNIIQHIQYFRNIVKF